MSHELRTPLNAVIGFAETMRLQPFGPIGSSKYLTYLEDIWKSGRHLLDIVDNVLEMARIDSGTIKLHLSGVDISALVADVVRTVDSMSGGPRAPIHIHMPGTPPTLLIDEKRTRQVLSQLVSNARKFTPPHGSIEISGRWNRAGAVEIAVTDTGIGMAPEDVAQALVPFSKADTARAVAAQGAGLGLPLASMIMELHGGALAVESVLGKGTCVTITFPSRCIADTEEPVIRVRYSN
jgi:signal transduction histidine kinase